MTISKNCVAIFLVLFAATLLAQEHDHAAMHPANITPLHLGAKVAIPTEAARPVYRPARCDQQGNVYFRAYQPEERRVPIVRADATGKTTRYSLDSDAAFAAATAYDFSVLPNGKVFQPVQLGKDVYIVAFDDKGAIRWKTRLEKQFWVSRLIAFDDANFLVIGTEPQVPQAPTSARTYQTVVAIFDASGHLVRNVSLERKAVDKPGKPDEGQRGEKQDQAANKPSEPAESETKTSPPLLAVLSSGGQADLAGKVYLMVHSEPPVVYLINAAGSVLGTWEIAPPAERMAAISMSLKASHLAVQFRHSFQGMSHGEDIISVFDMNRGAAKVYEASVPSELSSSALACFEPGGAIFVGPKPEPGPGAAAGQAASSLEIEFARPEKPCQFPVLSPEHTGITLPPPRCQ